MALFLRDEDVSQACPEGRYVGSHRIYAKPFRARGGDEPGPPQDNRQRRYAVRDGRRHVSRGGIGRQDLHGRQGYLLLSGEPLRRGHGPVALLYPSQPFGPVAHRRHNRRSGETPVQRRQRHVGDHRHGIPSAHPVGGGDQGKKHQQGQGL